MLENLDKRKLAYFIGFMSGDGSYSGGKGRTVRMTVTTTDIEVVDWISENIEEFSTDREVWNNNPKRNIYASKPSYTKGFSVKYSDVFKKHGILCKKPDRNIFNIPKKDFKYYLLGLIDADGCFTYTKRKDRDRLVGKFLITHPSMNILLKVQKFLLEELNISSAIAPKGNEKCFILSFSKLGDVMKFGDYLWSDKSAIVITRKYKNYLSFREDYLKRLDEGSMLPYEFIQSQEYKSLVTSISNNVYIAPDGKEYMSSYLFPKTLGEVKDITRWARYNRKGWSTRPKTNKEIQEYKAFVKREGVRLFKIWREQQ